MVLLASAVLSVRAPSVVYAVAAFLTHRRGVEGKFLNAQMRDLGYADPIGPGQMNSQVSTLARIYPGPQSMQCRLVCVESGYPRGPGPMGGNYAGCCKRTSENLPSTH